MIFFLKKLAEISSIVPEMHSSTLLAGFAALAVAIPTPPSPVGPLAPPSQNPLINPFIGKNYYANSNYAKE